MAKTIKKAQNGAKSKPISVEKLDKVADSLMQSSRTHKKVANAYYHKPGKFSKEDNDTFLKSSARAEKDSLNSVRYKKLIENAKSKKKMKNGGSLSALNASNKRVGSVDPKGAFTKVQKKTLAGAKGKASLTKDKQLGATKMAKKGMSIKKK